jgi:SAM-dependent methyltransferase
MSFPKDIEHRSASAYADFLLPHLRADAVLLDCGCGSGSITVGLASSVALAIGLDRQAATVRPAMTYVEEQRIANVHFLAGNASALPFADAIVDAVLLHSVLETTEKPLSFLRETRRVLTTGGIVAAASVEYGGLILAGPNEGLLHRFYSLREELWAVEGLARPRAGRSLRGLFCKAGFINIRATAQFMSYGTVDAVRRFGEARAAECSGGWFASRCLAHGLLSETKLLQMQFAWREWGSSEGAFAAFPWCRVVGWKP